MASSNSALDLLRLKSLKELRSLAHLFMPSQPPAPEPKPFGSGIGFHSLPADAVISIMFNIKTVQDLYSFIFTSPFVYSLFLYHKSMLLNRMAYSILGSSYPEGAEVLIWQRNSINNVPSYSAVVQDLKIPFVLQDRDLYNLVQNHRWYEICKDLYLTTHTRSLIRRQLSRFNYSCSSIHKVDWLRGIIPAPKPVPRRQAPLRAFIGSTSDERFPYRLFYITWLLQYRFRYESLPAFASREFPQCFEMLDTFLMARVMYCTGEYFENFINLGPRGTPWERMSIYTIWNQPTFIRGQDLWLRQKVLATVVAKSEATRGPHDNLQQWADAVKVLVDCVRRDYDLMNFEGLMEKYGLWRHDG